MQSLDIARIRTMQCDAEINAEERRVYYTPIVWGYFNGNTYRCLPVFNSHGQRVR